MKFYKRRIHEKGDMSVETGFRGGDLAFRLTLPNSTVSLTYQQASDLSDALDACLDQQDQDPLL